MMGHTHAVTGIAIWAGLLTVDVVPAEPVTFALGAAVCGGSAMVPDLDHRDSTIAHAAPPVTNLLAFAGNSVSGGHRHGTHSLLAVAVTWMATIWATGTWQWAAWAIIGVTAALCARAVGSPSFGAWGIGVAAVAIATQQPTPWLPLATTCGVAAHIAGDLLTKQGVPLLWPINHPRDIPPVINANGYWSVPIIHTTGNLREHLLGVVVAAAAVVMAASHLNL